MQTRELEENWAITKNVSHAASSVKVPLNSNSCKSLTFFFFHQYVVFIQNRFEAFLLYYH